MSTALKNVFFIRHAKSAWDNPNLPDIDRPLNERGHFIAAKMAGFIYGLYKLQEPEFISSPANRALTTATYFAEKFEINISNIKQDRNLYYGGELDYLKCLQQLNSKTQTAFVFGHNPTIETVVSKIENGYHGPVPTCAVFHCILSSKTFSFEKFNDLKIEHYYFPKNVLR